MVDDQQFKQLSTPRSAQYVSVVGSASDEEVKQRPRPRWLLYSSVVVPLLLPLQFGWSTSQLNLSTYNNDDDCAARPVADGACVVFPGHTKVQWTFAVNA
ncbi:hypothetical protein PHYBOEH_011234 [Phytophthora boehmeriae]|uniref:Uncharacterized protein n=1 Tax=Phytophthora boehmeriae TaxID=109152 RepID=A0A8T1VNK9_9STRA|nr:hypothetical protein PHYBOEH_011234 [Phytophthora boehmeriae]